MEMLSSHAVGLTLPQKCCLYELIKRLLKKYKRIVLGYLEERKAGECEGKIIMQSSIF